MPSEIDRIRARAVVAKAMEECAERLRLAAGTARDFLWDDELGEWLTIAAKQLELKAPARAYEPQGEDYEERQRADQRFGYKSRRKRK